MVHSLTLRFKKHLDNLSRLVISNKFSACLPSSSGISSKHKFWTKLLTTAGCCIVV